MQKVRSRYNVGKIIGKGGFGFVYEGYRISDNTPVAIKMCRRKTVVEWITRNGTRVPLEVVVLERAQAVAGVVRFYELFEDADEVAMVMERAIGVDLFDYVPKHVLQEDEAKRIFAQLVRTAIGCDCCGISHRDIKDENVIYDAGAQRATLIDFGSASFINTNDQVFDRFRGTYAFVTPEWLTSRKFGAEANTVWQLGTCLYNILQDAIPFDTEYEIVHGKLRWYRKVSHECADLISWCLRVAPGERFSLAQVAAHSWVAGEIDKFGGKWQVA